MKHRINFDTDKDLYRKFFKAVIDEGKNMTEVFIEFMESYLLEKTNEKAA